MRSRRTCFPPGLRCCFAKKQILHLAQDDEHRSYTCVRSTLAHMSDPTPPDTFAGAHLIAEAHEELRVLQETAADLESSRTLDAEDRATALHAAHKLVRLLDQGGMATGLQHAQDIISTLDQPGLPQPERLQQQVDLLSHLLFSDPAKKT